jgi:hypothetical protein
MSEISPLKSSIVVKKYFDKSTTSKDFQKDQLVLLWNKEKEKPSFHMKFEALWIGPYQIKKVIGYNSYLLKDMKGNNPIVSCKRETSETFFLLTPLS